MISSQQLDQPNENTRQRNKSKNTKHCKTRQTKTINKAHEQTSRLSPSTIESAVFTPVCATWILAHCAHSPVLRASSVRVQWWGVWGVDKDV